jgi:signal transduction histidine kinase
VRSFYGWMRGHPLVVDSVLALVVAILLGLFVAGPQAGMPAPAGLLFVIAMSVPVALRRRYPIGAFAVAVAVDGIQLATTAYRLGEPVRNRPLGSELAVVILLYTVAAYRRRRVSLAALVVFLAVSAIALPAWEPGSPHAVYSLAEVAAAFASPALVAWLLGDSMQWRRSYYRGLEERAVRAERELNAYAQVAAAAERARIARELHDVVAHNVSVMVVQADGAAFALETSPEKTRQALTAISRTGRQALAEMRGLLGVLRADADDEEDLTPQPGVEQLTALLEQTRAAGLPVSFTVAGVPRPLRAGAALTAYRVVQESLTNARKHGGPTVTAAVTLGFCEDHLVIKVTDSGRARTRAAAESDDGPDGRGHGLIGMRERVEVYGGTVTAGPQPRGGWRVTATLPLAPTGVSPGIAGGVPLRAAAPVVSPAPAASPAPGAPGGPVTPAEPGAA